MSTSAQVRALKETEPIKCVCVERELAHTIMEAGKSKFCRVTVGRRPREEITLQFKSKNSLLAEFPLLL